MLRVIGVPAVFAIVLLACCASPALAGSTEIPPGLGVDSADSGLDQPAGASPSGAFTAPVKDPPAVLRVGSLRQQFELPPLHDGGDDPAAQIARGTQVFQRANLLRIDSSTADAAWARAGETVAADRRILPTLLTQPLRKLTFKGTNLSQLGALIAVAGPAHITVVSPTLQADAALTITGQNLIVDFAGATIQVGAKPPVWLIQLVRARNVAVLNAKISGGTNGFLVDSVSNVIIEGNDLQGLTQNGIVATGASSSLNISANHLHELQRAGIMLDGPVRMALLEDNEIDHLLGHSNWHAGILLTSRGGDIAADPDTFFLADHYWVVTKPLVQRLQNPDENVILHNTIHDGLSSGIYNDGAIANVFLENRIAGNSKEGICFDNGATANVFAGNLVSDNGNRWGQADAYLSLDSVLGAGRGADATSLAKLPGISIDNALYNEILANDVRANFGGGVKMVRTGLFNVIGQNVITDNNLGESAEFHYFGVELGAAPADSPAEDLDFVGSSGNVVFGNTIHGKHYSGIFFGAGSVQNDELDNDISGVEAFALEAPSRGGVSSPGVGHRRGPG